MKDTLEDAEADSSTLVAEIKAASNATSSSEASTWDAVTGVSDTAAVILTRPPTALPTTAPTPVPTAMPNPVPTPLPSPLPTPFPTKKEAGTGSADAASTGMWIGIGVGAVVVMAIGGTYGHHQHHKRKKLRSKLGHGDATGSLEALEAESPSIELESFVKMPAGVRARGSTDLGSPRRGSTDLGSGPPDIVLPVDVEVTVGPEPAAAEGWGMTSWFSGGVEETGAAGGRVDTL